MYLTEEKPVNYLERLETLETRRDELRKALENSIKNNVHFKNCIDLLAADVEQLDFEISLERDNLAFQLMRERDRKYPAIAKGKLINFSLVEAGG